MFGVLLVILFNVLGVLIRYPLIGTLIVFSGLILPFPKVICPYLGPQCGFTAALTLTVDDNMPTFWKGYLLIIGVLIPLGMEQSKRRGELYDLKEGLAFYKSYHSNPINLAIHLICIPGILWSSIGLFSYSSPMFGPGTSPSLNWSAFISILYAQVSEHKSTTFP